MFTVSFPGNKGCHSGNGAQTVTFDVYRSLVEAVGHTSVSGPVQQWISTETERPQHCYAPKMDLGDNNNHCFCCALVIEMVGIDGWILGDLKSPAVVNFSRISTKLLNQKL